MKKKIAVVTAIVLLSFVSLIITDARTVSAQTVLDAVDSGSYTSAGDHDPTNIGYPAGLLVFLVFRNFLVFDLTGVTGNIESATLTLEVPVNSYLSLDPSETWTLYDVSTNIATLTAGGTGLTGIFDDLGTGTTYGSAVVTAADDGQLIDVTLNAAGVAALNAAKGGMFAMGGSVTTLGGAILPFEAVFVGIFPPSPVRTLTLVIAPEPVPTMNEWGFIMFFVLAGLAAAYRLPGKATSV